MFNCATSDIPVDSSKAIEKEVQLWTCLALSLQYLYYHVGVQIFGDKA